MSGSRVLPNSGDLCVFIAGNEVNCGFCFKADARNVWLTAPGASEAVQHPISAVMFWVPLVVMRNMIEQLDQPTLGAAADMIRDYYLRVNGTDYTDTGEAWDVFNNVYNLLTGESLEDLSTQSTED